MQTDYRFQVLAATQHILRDAINSIRELGGYGRLLQFRLQPPNSLAELSTCFTTDNMNHPRLICVFYIL